MSVTDVLRWAYSVMEYPWVLALIFVLVPLLYYIMRKTYLVVKEDLQMQIRKRRVRKLMMFTRTLMFILVLIALASPYVEREKIIEGDPFIQLLVDNSTSMSMFQDISQDLSEKLEKHLNTEIKAVGTGTVSNIGDSVLSNLQPHGSILLLSDGNANSGADLGDVALFASKINATINAIDLSAIRDDARPSREFESGSTEADAPTTRVGGPLVCSLWSGPESVVDAPPARCRATCGNRPPVESSTV